MRNPLDVIAALHKKALLENSGINPDALQLPPWPDDMRALPNDWARSALFSVRNKRTPRAALKNAEVFSIHKQVKITFTGIELRAEDDELVWQQIIDYAKPLPLGSLVEFSYYQLCKDLDWPINGRYYQRAEDCLSRLQANTISITTQHIDMFSLSMIDKFAVVESGSGKVRCQVQIDPRMIYLFANSDFAQVEWIPYRTLSPISRRLYDYIASHRVPYPIKLETFRRLCGSDSARPAKWAEQVRNACGEIETAGLVRKVWVEADSVYYEKLQPIHRKNFDRTTYLYRHFDSQDKLLYVGISLSAINRLSQHKVNSDWFDSIKRVEIEKFPTREEALMAEKIAIVGEAPLHNIQFSATAR